MRTMMLSILVFLTACGSSISPDPTGVQDGGIDSSADGNELPTDATTPPSADAPWEGAASSDNGQWGEPCPCPANTICQNLGGGSGCIHVIGGLTLGCFGFADKATCTRNCSVGSSSDCPSGFLCVGVVKDGKDYGYWCER